MIACWQIMHTFLIYLYDTYVINADATLKCEVQISWLYIYYTIVLSVCLCLTNYVSVYQNVDMGPIYDG